MIVLKVILCLIACGLIGLAITLAVEFWGYRQGTKDYTNVYESVVLPQKVEAAASASEDGSEVQNEITPNVPVDGGGEISDADTDAEIRITEEDNKPLVPTNIDFEKLKEINADCIGWISACSNRIDYPIVKSKDNVDYLTKTVSGAENKSGAIFADKDCTDPFNQFQTLIFGHNMKNGSMFHYLVNYREESYYRDHRLIYIRTEKQLLTYEVFAAYREAASDTCIYDSVLNPEDRAAFLKKVREKSLYNTGVQLSTSDRVLTLVTCEYTQDDYRMFVHAKLISVE